jgi:hypothetical protein
MPVTPIAGSGLMARVYNSGFLLSHDTYNGIAAASDGRIYYILCSEDIATGGQMYRFNPATENIQHVADLTEACGEKNSVCQGKSHVPFVESNGRLWFATHIGYYDIVDGKEMPGAPPPGRSEYPGGHVLAYDLATGAVEDFGIPILGEGILTMGMDTSHGLVYGLTWPLGRFFRFDIRNRQSTDLGLMFDGGELETGDSYRTICRSLAVNPRDGCVYFTRGEGSIHVCRFGSDTVEQLPGYAMRKDYFGVYAPASPGHMAYCWRQILWYAPEERFYGVHGNSGYLFTFDPRTGEVDLIDRLTSMPSRRSGMFDQFSYGYLGLTLGPDGETLYYLTGGPLLANGRRVEGKASTSRGEAKGEENLHLVTWHIPSRSFMDYGPIMLENGERPSYVNSIAVAADGIVYTLARVFGTTSARTDLIAIKPGEPALSWPTSHQK